MSRDLSPSRARRNAPLAARFPLQATAFACHLFLLSVGGAHAQTATNTLSEVVVSATGVEQKITDAPASISVVTREELSKRPYTTLLDAVRDIEGVDVGETTDKTGQGTISIRGMGADYTLILIDGKRQNNNGDLYPNNFGGNQFNHIPPIEAIERIEVIRGPMSTLYGADALGGVINIITRKIPNEWTGSVTQSFTFQENSDFGDDKTTDFNLMGPIKQGLLGLQIRGSYYDREASRPDYASATDPLGVSHNRSLGFGGGGKTVDNENHNLGLRLALTPNARHEFLFDVDTSQQVYDNQPEADGTFPLGTVDSIETIWRAQGGVVAPRVGYLPEQKFTRDQWSLTHKGKWDIGNSEISLSYVDTANKGRTLPFSPEERSRLQALWNAVPGGNATAKLNNMTPAQRAQLEAFLPRPARVMETRQYTLDGKLDMPFGNHLVVVGGQYIDGEMEDGTFDYFDEDGRSAKQFLLRNPLPNGKFRSGFGGRRHPILGYSKMHTGVDWAAPTGSPIIAAGNGVVEKSGWAGGYGKQTIIKHANGYETSYNHQSRIGEGIKPGVRVRQGQVIGYVGTTGLSTGAHLHYELIVNNRKVDPMRVRLPVGKVLKGNELEAFAREKTRIDELLKEEDGDALKVASANAKLGG